MWELCTRAIKLFKKTRTSASKNSIKGARELDNLSIHPMLKGAGYNEGTEKLLSRIRNYKPKQSHLEFKNESGEIEMNNSALKFIINARKQNERFIRKQADEFGRSLSKNSGRKFGIEDKKYGEEEEDDDEENVNEEIEDIDSDDDEDEGAKGSRRGRSNLNKR